MPRSVVVLPNFSGVAANQTANMALPIGPTYHAIQLTYGTSTGGGANQTNMEAEITEIRLLLDGKVQRTFSAADLFDYNAYHGVSVQAGILPIFFSPPWARAAQGEDAVAWGTADISNFTIEVDIGGATAPTLSARGIISRVPQPNGDIVKWKKFSYNAGGAGLFNIQDLPKIDAYYAIHFGTASIDNLKAKLDGVDVWDLTEAQMTAYLTDAGLTPQTGYYHLDYAATHRMSDYLPMRIGNQSASEYRLELTMAGASNFTAIAETVGPRD